MNYGSRYLKLMAYKKARELDMPPRLLLAALICMVENGQATNEQILACYRKLVLDHQKEKAIARMHSTRKKDREYGACALSEARTTLLELARDQSPADNSIDAYVGEGETLKNYHLAAWNLINEELVKVKYMYRKTFGVTDLAGIIKYFCPEEINRLQHLPA